MKPVWFYGTEKTDAVVKPVSLYGIQKTEKDCAVIKTIVVLLKSIERYHRYSDKTNVIAWHSRIWWLSQWYNQRFCMVPINNNLCCEKNQWLHVTKKIDKGCSDKFNEVVVH